VVLVLFHWAAQLAIDSRAKSMSQEIGVLSGEANARGIVDLAQGRLRLLSLFVFGRTRLRPHRSG
jgi:hypothetical protein